MSYRRSSMKISLLPLITLAVLSCSVPLRAQQFNSESIDIQRQLEHVRAYALRLNRAPILPQEAKAHVGKLVSVGGLAEQVAFNKGNAFLNFAERYHARHSPASFARKTSNASAAGNSCGRWRAIL